MRMSFDLDGVVCDGDSGMLNLLHNAHRRGDYGADVALRNYYLSRQIRLDPRMVTVPGVDKWIIITGRVSATHGWTEDWAYHHIPEGVLGLTFVGDAVSEELLEDGRNDEAGDLLADLKAGAIALWQGELHWDNNPRIVKRLRERYGIMTIQYGGAPLGEV